MEGEESGGSPCRGAGRVKSSKPPGGRPPVAEPTECRGLTQTPRVRTGLLRLIPRRKS